MGSGVPSVAVQYRCIHELVRHGDTGLVFSDSDTLARQLRELVGGFPTDASRLEALRLNLERYADTYVVVCGHVVVPMCFNFSHVF